MNNPPNTMWLSVGKSFSLPTAMVKQESTDVQRKLSEKKEVVKEHKQDKKKRKHKKDKHEHKKSKKSKDLSLSEVPTNTRQKSSEIATLEVCSDGSDSSFDSSSDEDDINKAKLERLQLIVANNSQKEIIYLPNGEVTVLDKAFTTGQTSVTWQLDYHADEDLPYLLGYIPHSVYSHSHRSSATSEVQTVKKPKFEHRYFHKDLYRSLMNPFENYWNIPLQSSPKSTEYQSHSGLIPLPVMDKQQYKLLFSRSSSSSAEDHVAHSYITNPANEAHLQYSSMVHYFPSALYRAPENLLRIVEYICIVPMMTNYLQTLPQRKSTYSLTKNMILGKNPWALASTNSFNNITYYLRHSMQYYEQKLQSIPQGTTERWKMKKKICILQELLWTYGGGVSNNASSSSSQERIYTLEELLREHPYCPMYAVLSLQQQMSQLFTSTSHSASQENSVNDYENNYLHQYLSWMKNYHMIQSFASPSTNPAILSSDDYKRKETIVQQGYSAQLDQWSLFLHVIFHAWNQREKGTAIIQAMLMLHMNESWLSTKKSTTTTNVGFTTNTSFSEDLSTTLSHEKRMKALERIWEEELPRIGEESYGSKQEKANLSIGMLADRQSILLNITKNVMDAEEVFQLVERHADVISGETKEEAESNSKENTAPQSADTAGEQVGTEEQQHPPGARFVYSRVHGYKIWVYPEDTTYVYKKILSDIDTAAMADRDIEGREEGDDVNIDSSAKISTKRAGKDHGNNSLQIPINEVDAYRQSYFRDYWLQQLQCIPLKIGYEQDNDSYLLALEEQPERVIMFQDLQDYIFCLPTQEIYAYSVVSITKSHVPAPPLPPHLLLLAQQQQQPIPSMMMLTATTSTKQSTHYSLHSLTHTLQLCYHCLDTLGIHFPNQFFSGHSNTIAKQFYGMTNFHTSDSLLAWQDDLLHTYHNGKVLTKSQRLNALIEEFCFVTTIHPCHRRKDGKTSCIRTSNKVSMTIESCVMNEYLLQQGHQGENKKPIGNGDRLTLLIHLIQQCIEYFTTIYTTICNNLLEIQTRKRTGMDTDDDTVVPDYPEWYADWKSLEEIRYCISDFRNMFITLLVVKNRLDISISKDMTERNDRLREQIRMSIQSSLLLPENPLSTDTTEQQKVIKNTIGITSVVGDLSSWICYLQWEVALSMSTTSSLQNVHKMIEKVLQAVNAQQLQISSQQQQQQQQQLPHHLSQEIEGVVHLYWYCIQVLLGMFPQAFNSSSMQRKNTIHLQEAEELLIQFAFSGFVKLTQPNTTLMANHAQLGQYDSILQSLVGGGSSKSKQKKKGTVYCYRSYSKEQKQAACQEALKIYQQYILEYAQGLYSTINEMDDKHATMILDTLEYHRMDNTPTIYMIVNMMVWLSWLSSVRESSSLPAVAEATVDQIPVSIHTANHIYSTSIELFRNILCSSFAGICEDESAEKKTTKDSTTFFAQWNTLFITQPTLSSAIHHIHSMEKDTENIMPKQQPRGDSLEERMNIGDVVITSRIHNELLLLLERLACTQAEFLLYTLYTAAETSCEHNLHYYRYVITHLEPALNDFPYHTWLHPLFIQYTMLYHTHDHCSLPYHQNSMPIVQQADRGKARLLSYYQAHRKISVWQVPSEAPYTVPTNHWLLPFHDQCNHSQTTKAWILRSYEVWISLIHLVIALPYMLPAPTTTKKQEKVVETVKEEVETDAFTMDWKYLLYEVLQVPRWSSEQYHTIQALFEQILFPTSSASSSSSSSSAVSSQGSVPIGCVWMWRLYYLIVAIHGDEKNRPTSETMITTATGSCWQPRLITPTQGSLSEAKKLFLRGLVVCGWCKDYYLDALGILRPVFTEKEIQSLLNVLERIGIVLRC